MSAFGIGAKIWTIKILYKINNIRPLLSLLLNYKNIGTPPACNAHTESPMMSFALKITTLCSKIELTTFYSLPTSRMPTDKKLENVHK